VFIRNIRNPWRDALLPASFRGANFHVESGQKESGRRLVVHEFPKRDYPYSEDMGRRAYQFSVRGYCIAYPHGTGKEVTPMSPQARTSLLYQMDYRLPRDALQEELSRGEPGVLQLPTLKPMTVMCQRWRLTEEERYGGYCVFDMQFVELGLKLGPNATDPRGEVITQTGVTRERVITRADGVTVPAAEP